MEFSFKYSGTRHSLVLDFDVVTLAELSAELQKLTGTVVETQKLIGPNLKTALKLAKQPTDTITQSGIVAGKMYTLLGTKPRDLSQVQSAREDPLTRGFQEEALLEARRRTYKQATARPPDGEFSFDRYETLKGEHFSPPPSAALNLLYRLAGDPGIMGIMQKYKWRVGLLSEMPPEGKVGISQSCILGYNLNKGAEISLRLRTDDLTGFRKYEKIRETLIHELTHMVHSDHDDSFYTLNSKLTKECAAINQSHQKGHFLLGETASYSPPTSQDGQRLGGPSPILDPAEAARQAALRRSAGHKTE